MVHSHIVLGITSAWSLLLGNISEFMFPGFHGTVANHAAYSFLDNANMVKLEYDVHDP